MNGALAKDFPTFPLWSAVNLITGSLIYNTFNAEMPGDEALRPIMHSNLQKRCVLEFEIFFF